MLNCLLNFRLLWFLDTLLVLFHEIAIAKIVIVFVP